MRKRFRIVAVRSFLIACSFFAVGAAQAWSQQTADPAPAEGINAVATTESPNAVTDSAPAEIDFENEIMPILTRYGCNSGPCHGKARGQGGFQLSLLGFDPDFDFDAIVKEGRGRRVFPGAPDASLLLQKPTGLAPHGGGKRLAAESPEYARLRAWILNGMPRRIEGAAKLQRITVAPDHVVLAHQQSEPLKITAEYSDGTSRDVTRLAQFQSNESPIVAVSDAGVVTAGMITGEAAIMARYMGHIAVCVAAVPMEKPVTADVYSALPRKNFIDDLVWKKLQTLGIVPSERCDDSTFLRRATTDICGRVPRPQEVQEFLEDQSPDKRERLVDRLLLEPDFADHWSGKWVDLLRPNPYHVGIKTVLNYDRWIREQFRERRPWNEFVYDLITSNGSTWRDGMVTIYRDRRTPEEITTLVSQLFVGIRLECAKCHHHPFEIWSQDDFYSFASYFARIGRKGTGISAPISGSEEYIFAGTSGQVNHPLTGKAMTPRPLFGKADPLSPEEDPRVTLAKWITSPENALFSQVMANRVWADMMARGLVEPVDDFRGTNPPSNAELMTALGNHFRDSGFSLTEIVRVIANSHVYQLTSLANDQNVTDTRYFSRHYRHRLRAEVLLDAFAQISGVPQSFSAIPPDTNARQIWTHRTESLFLDTFGRPDPNQDPPCERTAESTVSQTLHMMNSEQLHRDVISDQGTAARLAASDATPAALVDELYRTIFARRPDEEERKFAESLFAGEGINRRQVVEDLMWAMLNSPEFVLQN
ncbi:MAG: DUF1549 and DUF1553 domain-containing protein [Planctomyces sp.]